MEVGCVDKTTHVEHAKSIAGLGKTSLEIEYGIRVKGNWQTWDKNMTSMEDYSDMILTRKWHPSAKNKACMERDSGIYAAGILYPMDRNIKSH